MRTTGSHVPIRIVPIALAINAAVKVPGEITYVDPKPVMFAMNALSIQLSRHVKRLLLTSVIVPSITSSKSSLQIYSEHWYSSSVIAVADMVGAVLVGSVHPAVPQTAFPTVTT
jgi:hypothetical protein